MFSLDSFEGYPCSPYREVINPWDWQMMPEDIDDFTGFVYRITCLPLSKWYIGKKLFTKAVRKKPLKGKKRARCSRAKSDWENYFGSSNDLKADLEKYGKENFRREVLYLAKGKGVLSYFELKFQMESDAIFRSDSYNGILNVRLGRNVFPKEMMK